MQKTYWTLFSLTLFGIILSATFIVLLTVLFVRHFIKQKYFIAYTVVLVFAMLLCIYFFIPCFKDYNFVINNKFFEENAVVTEFTYIRDDPDGNGQKQYSSPKFYIENKNEYIVLNVSKVQVGKKYRIKYLPHTRICEILYCIE